MVFFFLRFAISFTDGGFYRDFSTHQGEAVLGLEKQISFPSMDEGKRAFYGNLNRKKKSWKIDLAWSLQFFSEVFLGALC